MHDPQPGRHLWWELLELDTQLSFLLGRRPCMDPGHGVPKPSPGEAQYEGKGSTKDALDFTEYMVEFLNHVYQNQDDSLTFWEDRRKTLHSQLTRLQQHHSKLPTLPQRGVPDPMSSALAQHQVDVELVLVVLYCQIIR